MGCVAAGGVKNWRRRVGRRDFPGALLWKAVEKFPEMEEVKSESRCG